MAIKTNYDIRSGAVVEDTYTIINGIIMGAGIITTNYAVYGSIASYDKMERALVTFSEKREMTLAESEQYFDFEDELIENNTKFTGATKVRLEKEKTKAQKNKEEEDK